MRQMGFGIRGQRELRDFFPQNAGLSEEGGLIEIESDFQFFADNRN
jgi:hypothetical protein